MKNSTFQTKTDTHLVFGPKKTIAALLVAFAPLGTTTRDRVVLKGNFSVGRGSECDLTIMDGKTSKKHLLLTQIDNEFWAQDLGSRNGTFIGGHRLMGKQRLDDASVIRVGQAVLVFHKDAASIFNGLGTDLFGMAGKFHTQAILAQLNEAVLSGRHILITGPSGTGKELAAKALAAMMGGQDGPFELVIHNSAQFASDEEALTTLFGVGAKVFSGVGARAGLIEQAEGGALFLDEIHNLSEKVQRSLLRVIEDGQTKRIGEATVRAANVRFIFASNVPDETKGLAHDLFARLRLVELPPLSVRVADIPSIFNEVFRAAICRLSLDADSAMGCLRGDHYEALCLKGFGPENVRGLVDFADRLATRIKAGLPPNDAIYAVFSERFSDGLVANRSLQSPAPGESDDASVYEQNRQLIISLYQKCNGNISAVGRALRDQGVSCSRRLLVKYAIDWGLRNEE